MMNQHLAMRDDLAADAQSENQAAIVAAILTVLATDSPRHARAILTETRAAGFDLSAEPMRGVLRDLINRALFWVEVERLVVPTLDVLACLGSDAAMAGFDMLFGALFPDGTVEPTRISNSAVVVLTRLLAEVGHLDDALQFLVTAQGHRDGCDYIPLVHAARCHMLGLDGSIVPLWPELPSDRTGGDALDPRTWRVLARQCATCGDWSGAVDALTTAMTLPASKPAKTGVGADFAVLAVFLRTRDQARLIETSPHVAQALRAAPGVAAGAMTMLTHWPHSDVFMIYDATTRAMVHGWVTTIVHAAQAA